MPTYWRLFNHLDSNEICGPKRGVKHTDASRDVATWPKVQVLRLICARFLRCWEGVRHESTRL